MKITNFKKLRAFIAKLPEGACDMCVWNSVSHAKRFTTEHLAALKRTGFDCGTAGCLGGWAQMLMVLSGHSAEEINNAGERKWLGITREERDELFFSFDKDSRTSWKVWMLRRLDAIIRTGKIRKVRAYQSST